jgi:RNA polymerase sigma-70 factor (ECF subfamily)
MDSTTPPPASDAFQRDLDIVGLLRAGALRPAFDRLAARYQDRVFRLCCALLREPARAEDAAQESLLRVWRALPRYDGRAALSTWIYAITRNRCLTELGRPGRHESLADPQIEAQAEALAAPEPQHAPARHAVLHGMIETLPEAYRRALTLYYYEERSIPEVAAMLALPAATVKTHLHRARALMRERLQRLDLYDSKLWL